MTRILIAIVFMFLSSFVSNAEPGPETVNRVMANVVEKFVLPGYRDFRAKTRLLGKRVKALCSQPNAGNLELARQAFSETALGWASIEIIRFGPVAEENRFERVLFYPDRKGTGLKQVQRILANRQDNEIEPGSIPGKSVAVQGLGALEFVLFGTGSGNLGAGDDFRCRFAMSIAGNLENISNSLVKQWSPDGTAYRTWTDPNEKNPVFQTPREAVNELLGTLVHGLEAIKDIRIGSFLKKEAGKDRPRLAIFRRSQNTIPVIVANIQAVQKLIIASDAGQLVEADQRAIIGTVLFELEQATKVANEIAEPVGKSIRDKTLRSKLVYLTTSLKFAIDILDQDFASASGLSSGFSFSDGD